MMTIIIFLFLYVSSLNNSIKLLLRRTLQLSNHDQQGFDKLSLTNNTYIIRPQLITLSLPKGCRIKITTHE
jgi:hypothetical protein